MALSPFYERTAEAGTPGSGCPGKAVGLFIIARPVFSFKESH